MDSWGFHRFEGSILLWVAEGEVSLAMVEAEVSWRSRYVEFEWHLAYYPLISRFVTQVCLCKSLQVCVDVS